MTDELKTREAVTIIGIYRGFASAIGCGQTFLSLDYMTWRLEWYSPTPKRGRQYKAMYGFDASVIALDKRATHGYEPEEWGRILATEVRQKWGGNPHDAEPGSKPIILDDGLDVVTP